MCSENIVDDRLSELPEDVVTHILSLMPTEYAVRSSILSKRWRYSWLFVTNLDFDTDFFSILAIPDTDRLIAYIRFRKFVDRVLKFCKSPQLHLFRLHTAYPVEVSRLPTWIDKAVNLNVQEVDIRVNLRDLPLSLCTCKTLTNLRLHRRPGASATWKCLCVVNLPCLKALDIDVFTNPLVNAFKLIRGCPVLESLSLEVQSNVGREDEDYIFNIPTLKRLKLTLNFLSRNNKVFLNVPKLEHLFLGGVVCSLFVMEDVSSLAEATLSFDGLGVVDRNLWVTLVMGLTGVKSLSAQSLNSRGCFEFISCLPVFPNMKHLELKRFGDPAFIPRILESCPQLTHLCIEHVDCACLKSAFLAPALVPASMLTNLTTVKFKSEGENGDIEILEYMLGNGEVLKTVTISWHNLSSEEEMWLGAQLLNVSRVSPDCEIILIPNCSPSTTC